MISEGNTIRADVGVLSKLRQLQANRNVARKSISLPRALGLVLLLPVILTVTGAILAQKVIGVISPISTFGGPSQSSPIALSRDETFLVNVNPDADTVSIFSSNPNARYGGSPTKVAEVPVGHRPSSVA